MVASRCIYELPASGQRVLCTSTVLTLTVLHVGKEFIFNFSWFSACIVKYLKLEIC